MFLCFGSGRTWEFAPPCPAARHGVTKRDQCSSLVGQVNNIITEYSVEPRSMPHGSRRLAARRARVGGDRPRGTGYSRSVGTRRQPLSSHRRSHSGRLGSCRRRVHPGERRRRRGAPEDEARLNFLIHSWRELLVPPKSKPCRCGSRGEAEWSRQPHPNSRVSHSRPHEDGSSACTGF